MCSNQLNSRSTVCFSVPHSSICLCCCCWKRGSPGAFPQPSPSSHPSEPIASVCCHILRKPVAGSSRNWETRCWSVWFKIKAINFVHPWGYLKGHSEAGIQWEARVLADEDGQGILRCRWERTQWLQILSPGQGDDLPGVSRGQLDLVFR